MLRPTPQRSLRSALVVVAALAAITLLSGCWPSSNDSKSATAGLPNVLQQLTANEWILNPSASSLAHRAGPITIVFSTTHLLSGAMACNTYRGHFTLDESTISISGLGQSLKACDPKGGAAEHEYLKTLGTVRHVENTRRDRLELTAGSNVHLVYDARTPKEP
jgi:heat shock protein HslJ